MLGNSESRSNMEDFSSEIVYYDDTNVAIFDVIAKQENVKEEKPFVPPERKVNIKKEKKEERNRERFDKFISENPLPLRKRSSSLTDMKKILEPNFSFACDMQIAILSSELKEATVNFFWINFTFQMY